MFCFLRVQWTTEREGQSVNVNEINLTAATKWLTLADPVNPMTLSSGLCEAFPRIKDL